MMRTQPPGFRWLVGGFALVAAVAFGFHYRSARDPADLIFGVLCLVAAGYWLVIDREPPSEDPLGDGFNGAGPDRDDKVAGGPGRGEQAAPDSGLDGSR
jgi:hypothetical protein